MTVVVIVICVLTFVLFVPEAKNQILSEPVPHEPLGPPIHAPPFEGHGPEGEGSGSWEGLLLLIMFLAAIPIIGAMLFAIVAAADSVLTWVRNQREKKIQQQNYNRRELERLILERVRQSLERRFGPNPAGSIERLMHDLRGLDLDSAAPFHEDQLFVTFVDDPPTDGTSTIIVRYGAKEVLRGTFIPRRYGWD